MTGTGYTENVLNEQCRHAFVFLCYYLRDLASGQAAYEERFGDFLLANAALEADLTEKTLRLARAQGHDSTAEAASAAEAREQLITLASGIHKTLAPLSGDGEASLRGRLTRLAGSRPFSVESEDFFTRLAAAYASGNEEELDALAKDPVSSATLEEAWLEARLAFFYDEAGRVARAITARNDRSRLATPLSRATEEARLEEKHEELCLALAQVEEELASVHGA